MNAKELKTYLEKFKEDLAKINPNPKTPEEEDANMSMIGKYTKLLTRANGEQIVHNTTGPAFVTSTLEPFYYVFGNPVPEQWILNPESITPEMLMREKNEEVKSQMIAILLDNNRGRSVAEILGTVVIDEKENTFTDVKTGKRRTETLTLHKTKSPISSSSTDGDNPQYACFVEAVCSTKGEICFLSVPDTLTDALEAMAWTWGKTKEEYILTYAS